MTFRETSQHLTGALQYALIALCALGTLLVLGWLLKYSPYGIDFTDESFYLVWISNPFIYDVSITQYGFIYHPLYTLLGGDIAALRQVNIVITFGLAWVLTYTFLTSLAPKLEEHSVPLHAVAAGLATSVFIFFDSGLLTPSYNSLALQSLLVTAIGLILAERHIDRTSVIGWILIGVGGWLAFMAKPSTALALSVGVFVCLLFSRKFSIRLLSLAAASAFLLLVASAQLIDGSLLRFIERLELSIEFSKYLSGGHTLSQIVRIDEFQLGERSKLAILLLFAAVFVAIWSMWVENKKWRYVGGAISFVFFALTALPVVGQIHRVAGFGQFQDLLIFGPVFATALAGLVLGRKEALATNTASQWAIGGLFLVMPHIYAFGTNGNYWQAGGAAAIFWLLAGLTFLGPLFRKRASWLLAVPIALGVQAVTVTLLQAGFEQPYRQTQPLRLNASVLEIGPQRSPLVLSEGYAEYIAGAAKAAREAGFQPASPMIDLSGQSPGILYAMGAESIGQAWTIGGYPGSLKLAQAMLARAPCEKIARAWVLLEEDGPRSISTKLMDSLGMDFLGGYERVGAWQTAEGAGGYAARRTQELYKPIKPQEALTSCQTVRAKAVK